MKRARVALASALLACLVAGCTGHGLARLQVEPATASTRATFLLDTSKSSLYQRGVLYVEPGKKVRVTIEAPDLKTPFTVDKVLESLASGVQLTVDQVPAGLLRVVTLQWLDDAGKPLDGIYYRAQGTLDESHQRLSFNKLSTAEGEALLALIKKHPDLAASRRSDDIHTWMSGVLATTRATDARFLDIDAIAEAMSTLSTNNVPDPKPEWGLQPAFVSQGFTDIQAGLRLQAFVNDPVSGAGETRSGETLLLGPVPARVAPYQVGVRVLPTADELVGADLVQPTVAVTLKAQQTLVQPLVSLSRSQPGKPMPARVGRASVGVVSGSEDALWLLGGVQYPDAPGAVALASFAPLVPSTASPKGYRYKDSAGWDAPLALGASFPLYGAACASVGTQLFCFGGIVNEDRSGFAAVLETGSGTPAFTSDALALPAADGESALRLTYAVAGALNNKIYLTGGTAHDNRAAGADGVTPDNGLAATLVFDPATKAFGAPLPGPAAPLKAMAGGVVNGKWYLFGGFSADRTPTALVQVFDPTTSTWSVGKHAMPTARYGAATAVVDNKIWVIGGETLRGGATRAVEVYDPAADTWTRRAPLKTASSFAAAVVANRSSGKRIVVAGGVEGVSPGGFPLPVDKALVEELTP